MNHDVYFGILAKQIEKDFLKKPMEKTFIIEIIFPGETSAEGKPRYLEWQDHFHNK